MFLATPYCSPMNGRAGLIHIIIFLALSRSTLLLHHIHIHAFDKCMGFEVMIMDDFSFCCMFGLQVLSDLYLM